MSVHFSQQVWEYLSPHQKDLFETGSFLLDRLSIDNNTHISDFSFLVFPFAKAYEGYLKQLFLDTNYISEEEYESDYLRLGKLLSPSNNQPDSVYVKIRDHISSDLAKRVWKCWKSGRNEVFHYFPHNYKMINFLEAREIIMEIVRSIEETYQKLFDNCAECKSKKYQEKDYVYKED